MCVIRNTGYLPNPIRPNPPPPCPPPPPPPPPPSPCTPPPSHTRKFVGVGGGGGENPGCTPPPPPPSPLIDRADKAATWRQSLGVSYLLVCLLGVRVRLGVTGAEGGGEGEVKTTRRAVGASNNVCVCVGVCVGVCLGATGGSGGVCVRERVFVWVACEYLGLARFVCARAGVLVCARAEVCVASSSMCSCSCSCSFSSSCITSCVS